jgi:hypothetical protein
VELGTLAVPGVLRRVMRDTRPPTDLRQSKAPIAADRVNHDVFQRAGLQTARELALTYTATAERGRFGTHSAR